MSVLGDRLKELREKRGLTQSQLGEKVNLAESTISLYESGKRSPNPETIATFAVFFGVTTDYLLGMSDSPHITLTPENAVDPEIAKILSDNQIAKLNITRDITVEELEELIVFYKNMQKKRGR